LIDDIKQNWSPEDWAKLTAKEKNKIEVRDLGLNAIASKLGVKGNPRGNHKFHLEIGKMVWGDLPCFALVK